MKTLIVIKQWFTENAPKILEELNEPATESEIGFVEKETGIELPEDFKELLRTHNGMNGSYPLFFGDGHELLTCEQIVEEYRYGRERHEQFSDDLQQYQEWKDMAAKNQIDIGGPVKPHASNPKWLPISSENGDILRYLDFDPADGGTLGQVIEVYLEGVCWEVLAPSFALFLTRFHKELISKHYEVNEYGGVDKKEEYYPDSNSWPVPDWLKNVSDEVEFETQYDKTNWHLDIRVMPPVAVLLSSQFPLEITIHDWQDYEPSKIDSEFYDLVWAPESGGLFIAFCKMETFSDIASKIEEKSKEFQLVKLKVTLMKHDDLGNKKSHPKLKCWLEATKVELIY